MGRKKPRREILSTDWVVVDASGSIISDASGGLYFIRSPDREQT